MTSGNKTEKTGKAVIDFRKVATFPLSKGEATAKGAVVDLRPNQEASKFPFAVVVWDEKKDNFGVALPVMEDGWERHLKDCRSESKNFSMMIEGSKTAANLILHRMRVHFFHEGYATVKDSGAFFSPEDLFQELPQLAERNVTFSSDNNRVIENLTHDQTLSLLKAFIAVNQAEQDKQKIDQARDEKVNRLLANSLTPK